MNRNFARRSAVTDCRKLQQIVAIAAACRRLPQNVAIATNCNKSPQIDGNGRKFKNSEVYMNAHSAKIKEIENYYKTSESTGLKREQVEKNRRDFGKNEITARKKKTVFKRFLEALSEPTLIILEFAWVITLGINVGKFVKNGSCDVYECVGIFAAILISACLTVFMEGRSEKAFELLGSVYDKISVKVIRDGRVTVIPKEEIVVGDLEQQIRIVEFLLLAGGLARFGRRIRLVRDSGAARRLFFPAHARRARRIVLQSDSRRARFICGAKRLFLRAAAARARLVPAIHGAAARIRALDRFGIHFAARTRGLRRLGPAARRLRVQIFAAKRMHGIALRAVAQNLRLRRDFLLRLFARALLFRLLLDHLHAANGRFGAHGARGALRLGRGLVVFIELMFVIKRQFFLLAAAAKGADPAAELAGRE